jgi:hypothetical protein
MIQSRSAENTAGHGGGVAERSAATRPLPATANEAVDGGISDCSNSDVAAGDVSRGREGVGIAAAAVMEAVAAEAVSGGPSGWP